MSDNKNEVVKYGMLPYIDEDKEPIYIIWIKEGPYKDVYFQYGEVSIDESKKDDPHVNFSYRLFEELNEQPIDELYDDKDFNDILFQVLCDIFQNEEAKIGERPTTNENRQESTD